MQFTIENVEFLLLIAALVAMLAQRVRIPYTVGLVLAGIALSFLPFMPEIELSKELIFTILLPPLIFEATLFIRWRELIRNLPVIIVFVTSFRETTTKSRRSTKYRLLSQGTVRFLR